ncbi:MAG: hypothetical protein HY433_01840 [Candidatus Liptonbacteria bacterium]|nr:hypothetical protein [Candidatus Liptonbacteria bacterium]
MTTDQIVAQLQQSGYAWVEHRITQEHFPMREWKCDGSLLLLLISYKMPVSSEYVLRDVGRRLPRPLYEHGLIGALQRPRGNHGRIVLLMQPWEDNPNGDSVVMSLESDARSRRLDLIWWKKRTWPIGTLFGFPEPNGCKK